ncbi:MAG: EpsG family protein [Pseudoalteromonas nigrifaciens]
MNLRIGTLNIGHNTHLLDGANKVDIKLYISGCLLLLSWLFLPLILWVFGLFLYAFAVKRTRFDNVLAITISVSLSILIASRFIGYLWGGSDDMPSYLMAYERYDQLSSMLSVSLLYAKHGDALFGLYSWAVALVSDNHAFIYYFLSLLITYGLIWKFCKLVDGPSPLLCFLLIILFYKFFQFQWHLIRACMAVPILLSGIYYAHKNKKAGALIFVLGGLVHFSTFFLLLPLFIFTNHLNRRWRASELFFMFMGFILVAVVGVISIKVLGSVVNNYMINKILTRLVFEPDFSKLSSLLFFIAVNIVAIPGYLKTSNVNYLRLFNMMSYLTLLSFVALFFIGEELHRLILPLYLLYAPLLLLALRHITPKTLTGIFLFLLMGFHIAVFSYVMLINESKFFYKDDKYRHPIENRGLDYLVMFKNYLNTDITYYDGYRNK